MIYENGNFYIGGISKGKRHKESGINDNSEGRMVYANGDVYVGQWHDDLKSFSGTMRYANGDEYSGGWELDQRSGNGRMNDGKDCKWVKNSQIKKGKYVYP